MMKVHTGKKFCLEFIKDQCQAHSQYTLKTYQKVKLLYVKSLLGILIYFQKFLRLTRGQITHFGASAILRVTKRDQMSCYRSLQFSVQDVWGHCQPPSLTPLPFGPLTKNLEAPTFPFLKPSTLTQIAFFLTLNSSQLKNNLGFHSAFKIRYDSQQILGLLPGISIYDF